MSRSHRRARFAVAGLEPNVGCNEARAIWKRVHSTLAHVRRAVRNRARQSAAKQERAA